MGIDLDKFHPVSEERKISLKEELGAKDNNFLFVYAAEFSKRKNQSLLIRAFADVCKEYSEMKLLLAGNGTLFEDCKQLAQELHAEKSILFLGYVSNMSELYSICNACVTTSLSEGLPFNVMEAMACGLPVIASDIKGHRELIKDGTTGFLFESDNQQQLAKVLKDFYLNKKNYTKLKEAEKSDIQKYDIKLVEDILEKYRIEL
jgi:glycosyltransferase EpsD